MENLKTITESLSINISQEKVWDTLYNRFGEIYLFNPNLEGSHTISGTAGEPGCERQCNLDSRTFIRERIIRADLMKTFTVDVIGGNMPLVKDLQVTFTLQPKTPFKTEVVLQVAFTTRPAFMALVMKVPFQQRFKKMLIGLKYYLETGQIVTKKSFPSVRKQYIQLRPDQSFSYSG